MEPVPHKRSEMGVELAVGLLAPDQLFRDAVKFAPYDGPDFPDLSMLFASVMREQDLSGLSWLSVLVLVIALLGSRHRRLRQEARNTSGGLGTRPPEDEFFANAAHEIRTPAATIKASAEVLADTGRAYLPETLHRLVLNIDHEAERLCTLLDDLLDYELIRAARSHPHLVPFDLREVAHRALESVWPLARQREQTLSLALPDDQVWALVDAELLERAIVNLLVNAVKYGPDCGRVAVTLEVSPDTPPAHAVFAIRDSGPGIPVDDLERVFERFYRSSLAETRRIQGSGLGLPICRAAIELHGGRVWVERRPEGGSLFKVAVPLLVTAASAGSFR